VFTPVLAKHSKSFSFIDCISVGVDRMQRNFEPMRKQVEAWQKSELQDVTAKVVIYEAFVEGGLEAPKHMARTVHDLYFLCGAEIYVAPATVPVKYLVITTADTADSGMPCAFSRARKGFSERWRLTSVASANLSPF